MPDHQDIKSGKTIAVISYFYLLGVLIAYLTNSDKKSEFAYFHIRQSLGLWLSFMALGYPIGYFDKLRSLFGCLLEFYLYMDFRRPFLVK